MRTRTCNTCILYVGLCASFLPLSLVGDKDSEIARQLYLYGGDLGSIRKNDSTVGVISLGVRLELRLGLGGKARARDKARIRLHARPHLPWSHSSATVCSSVHTEPNHGVGVRVLSSLILLTTIWLCYAVCSLLLCVFALVISYP